MAAEILKGITPMVYLKKIVDGYELLSESAVLNGGCHKIQEIGVAVVPDVLDVSILDKVIMVFSLRFPPILVMKSIMGWNVCWKSSFVSTSASALKSI
ncbi:hypothetical protein QVD17_19182 [Tagetes erecta]|uniref:Uncharacterized protein n=2 Tax=Tagetes erecta TaxID=13708 RepID=A0AAD8NWB2_TARER|nr:hypothetical protein QVD17_19182 [Tagetes erecta]